MLWLALQIPCSLVAKLIAVPLPRPDSEIKKRAQVPRLRGSDSEVQLPNCCAPSSTLLWLCFHNNVRECSHYKLAGVGGHQLPMGLTQTSIAIAVPRT